MEVLQPGRALRGQEGGVGREKRGGTALLGAPEVAGDGSVLSPAPLPSRGCPEPRSMGEQEPGLQHSPSPLAGDRRGQQRCPERAGSHRPPSIALLEAQQGEPLVLPWKPRHGKGAAGGVESTPQFPMSPLGDAGEGCIAVGWGPGGLKPAGCGALWISILRPLGPCWARRRRRRRIAPGGAQPTAPGPERMLKEVRCMERG